MFASDNLSSSAFATEEILHVLVPAVGVGAFALVVLITGAMLVVLALLVVSYRETIRQYPPRAAPTCDSGTILARAGPGGGGRC